MLLSVRWYFIVGKVLNNILLHQHMVIISFDKKFAACSLAHFELIS